MRVRLHDDEQRVQQAESDGYHRDEVAAIRDPSALVVRAPCQAAALPADPCPGKGQYERHSSNARWREAMSAGARPLHDGVAAQLIERHGHGPDEDREPEQPQTAAFPIAVRLV